MSSTNLGVAAAPLAVSIDEAGRLLGLSKSTIKGLLRDKELKSARVGKRRLIRVLDLEEFLKARSQ